MEGGKTESERKKKLIVMIIGFVLGGVGGYLLGYQVSDGDYRGGLIVAALFAFWGIGLRHIIYSSVKELWLWLRTIGRATVRLNIIGFVLGFLLGYWYEIKLVFKVIISPFIAIHQLRVDEWEEWWELSTSEPFIYRLFPKRNSGLSSMEQYFNSGLSYYKSGDYNSAIREFSSVISLDPQHTGAYQLRGDSYYNLGKYKEARADFETVLRTPVNHSVANDSAVKDLIREKLAQIDEKEKRE